jgi:hypothetical protein
MDEDLGPAKLSLEQADELERLVRNPAGSGPPNPMEIVGEVFRDYLLLLVRAARGASQVTERGDSDRRVLLLLVQRELSHWPRFEDVEQCLKVVMGTDVDLSPFAKEIRDDLIFLSPVPTGFTDVPKLDAAPNGDPVA